MRSKMLCTGNGVGDRSSAALDRSASGSCGSGSCQKRKGASVSARCIPYPYCSEVYPSPNGVWCGEEAGKFYCASHCGCYNCSGTVSCDVCDSGFRGVDFVLQARSTPPHRHSPTLSPSSHQQRT